MYHLFSLSNNIFVLLLLGIIKNPTFNGFFELILNLKDYFDTATTEKFVP